MLNKYYYNGHIILPPKADIVFKAIFGTEESKDLLAAFLRDMLDLDIEDGNSLELLNTELVPVFEDGKLVRLDVRVKLRTGENVDVEIQVNDGGDTIPRNLFCNDRLFTSQLKKGMDYWKLGKAINLVILDFNLFKNKKNWYNKFRFKNVETGEELTSLKELTFVELPKWLALKRRAEDILSDEDKMRRREMWSLFLSTDSGEVLNMLAKKDETMRQAVEKLVLVSADDILQDEYDRRLISELDHYSRITHAMEKGMEDGFKKGLEQGRSQGLGQGLEQGLEQGLSQGLRQGREEGEKEKAFDIAHKMRRSGFSDEEISDMTGLHLEDIQYLR